MTAITDDDASNEDDYVNVASMDQITIDPTGDNEIKPIGDEGQNHVDPASDSQQHNEEEEQKCQYQCRKPKWWTQLSGRRGTRAQRKSIQRMSQRGYCFSMNVLKEFSRENNTKKKSAVQDESSNASGEEGWKRAWWNRALAIANDVDEIHHDETPCAIQQNDAIWDNYYLSNESADYNTNPLPPQSYKQKWLEIGFGSGDNILANSKNNPSTLFMGSEIHQPGIGTVLRRMETEVGVDKNLEENKAGTKTTIKESDAVEKTQSPECDVIEDVSLSALNIRDNSIDDIPSLPQNLEQTHVPYQNVRILPGDGIKLLSHLPSNYLDAILITFPDPWPGNYYVQWRVIQKEMLNEMRRVLKTSCRKNGTANNSEEGKAGCNCDNSCYGRAFIATDAECFDSWTRQIFSQESCSKATGNESLVTATDDNACVKGAADSTTTTKDRISSMVWKEVLPCPDRNEWLPIVSYYEQKGMDEGRHTMLQCWQVCG